MPDIVIPSVATRYVLQLQGEKDEHGLAENVFRFQATLAGAGGQQDLCMIHGFSIENEAKAHLCIEILNSNDDNVACKPIVIHYGHVATEKLRSADVKTGLCRRNIIFLFGPVVLDISDQRIPGTRLISALFHHFSDRSFSVAIDLGTEEEDEDFNHLFFPDIEDFNLEYVSTRLFVGEWGYSSNMDVEPFEFGVVYS